MERIKSREYYLAQQHVMRRCGRDALHMVLPSTESLEEIEGDKYEELSHRFHANMASQLTITSFSEPLTEKARKRAIVSVGIPHGYRVMGRLLGHSVGAYSIFAKNSGRNPDVSVLRDLLLADQAYNELVAKLANANPKWNISQENSYHLLDGGYRSRRAGRALPCLEIIEVADNLHILPKADLESIAIAGAPNDCFKELGPTEGCPAERVLLPKLWRQMVTVCSEHPDYFAADLASAS